jgi:hypothetical protein
MNNKSMFVLWAQSIAGNDIPVWARRYEYETGWDATQELDPEILETRYYDQDNQAWIDPSTLAGHAIHYFD